ncbi:hypothetical protein HK098_000219, partial [Nowakowskiella sp. JEL0407]
MEKRYQLMRDILYNPEPVPSQFTGDEKVEQDMQIQKEVIERMWSIEKNKEFERDMENIRR